MSRLLAAVPTRPVLPSFANTTSLLTKIAVVVFGTALLTASSWISVPMVPVPITLQALAVTMVGAFYGWRLAGLTVLAWLVEAAIGMPVLAGGHSGVFYMAGPTGGYLVAFLVTAALVGWTADRGWLGRSPFHALGIMLGANLLILVIGALWLAQLIGFDAAIAKGVTPFVVGGLVKGALATGLVEAVGRIMGPGARGR